MQLAITHLTTYTYADPTAYALQQLRVIPRSRPGQRVGGDWVAHVEGGTTQARFADHHGNSVLLVSLDPGRSSFTVRTQGHVVTEDRAGVFGEGMAVPPRWLYQQSTPLTAPDERLAALVAPLGQPAPEDLSALHALSQRIREAVAYTPGRTHADTTAAEALALGHGVCQDHAQIFISAARRMGFPARYVSGYLMMLDRSQQDAGHAWAEAWVQGLGWVGFDVSNAICPDARYVAVAFGCDSAETAPVRGLRFGQPGEELSVSLQVQQQ